MKTSGEGVYKIMDYIESKGYERIPPGIYFTSEAIYGTVYLRKEGRHNMVFGIKVLKDDNIIDILLSELRRINI